MSIDRSTRYQLPKNELFYYNENLKQFLPLVGNDGAIPMRIVREGQVAEEPFNGSTNITKTFTNVMNGFVISNDGGSNLTISINNFTFIVSAGEVFEDEFSPFSTVTINSTVPYRAYGKRNLGANTVSPIIDTSPPNNVVGLVASNITDIGITLSWGASTSTDLVGYNIYNGSTLIAVITSLIYNITGLVQNTQYTFIVKARDYSGNLSSGISVIVSTSQSTTPTPTDSTPPNNVTNLVSSNLTTTGATLTWTASNSTDVVGYDIYRNNTFITTVTGTTYNATGLSNSTQYAFSVRAKDGSNNVASGTSVTITTTTPTDVTPPNNATNLQATNIANTTLTLTWTASTSSDIASYDIYNGSTLVSNATGTLYNISGLSASTQYTFNVKAKDTSGNISSGISITVSTTAIADTTSPNNVTNLATSNVSTTGVTLGWTASTSTDTVGYNIYNGTTLVTTTTNTSYTVTGLTASTQYTFVIKAKDGANNIASGTSVTFTTVAVDTTPPNDVTNLTSSNVTGTSLTLSWTASTSSDIASYDIYNGSTFLANVTGVTYGVTGLTTSTSYTFYVKAKDNSGNVSNGASVTITTSASIDTTPPVVTVSPNGGTFTSSQNVTLSANETATIYYTLDGTTPTTASTVYSSLISISANTTLKYFAIDSAGNSSTIQTQVYTMQTMIITATPSSGTYASAQSVTLSSNITGGTIYYTTDGSHPTTSSSVFSGGSISWSSSGTIRAIVKDSTGNLSNPQVFYYLVALSGTNGHYSYSTSTSFIYTKASEITYDQIEIDIKPSFVTGVWQYAIDFRGAGVSNGYLARTSANADEIGSGFSSVSVNGVNGTTGTVFVTDATRQTIRATLKTATTFSANGNFMQTNTNHLNGDLYGIKFLNGGNIVAQFDLTNNYGTASTIIPDTINGLQLTNSGGTWVAG